MRGWQAHQGAVQFLTFTPDGGTLATAGAGDPAVRLWDLAAGAERQRLALFQEAATCLAFAPDGRTLAAGRNWSVELWDTVNGGRRLILEGHRHVSSSLAFSPDGTQLLSAGLRRGGFQPGAVQAIVWGVADGQVHAEFIGPAADGLGLAHALDARTALWVLPDAHPKSPPSATVIDVVTGHIHAILATPGPARAAAVAPDGRTLAAAVRGEVHLWPAAEVLTPPTAPGPPRPTWEVVRRWLGRTAKPSPAHRTAGLILGGAAERIDVVAFSPDGRRLLTGSARSAVRLWDVPDLEPAGGDGTPDPARLAARASFDWGIGPVTALAFAPDGLTAVAGGQSGQVVVWDVEG